VASASPAEVRLVRPTLDDRFFAEFPPRLIGDKAYDSDPLDEELLHECAIDLIAPHKDNRVRPATQDGRSLRRYTRRWTVERFFAWLHNSRRLVVRWEQHVQNFLAMLHLACIRILLRAL
jgi:transposase